jgi:hypothetical protein
LRFRQPIGKPEFQWTCSTTIVTDLPDAITAPETILDPSTTIV